ncbi:hypothetical protein [Aureimonas sp. AU4]|uniref:hypothetical protein n=1 Tax=Aureimonas sp. AU4 TaxID=1638163 RepID=UPI000A74FCD8|nr:hypothetical protein [Aureimonas sp. AU4]
MLDQFVRSAYGELNGEFFMVRVPVNPPPGTPAETARLISAYNKAFDTVPKPIDAMAEVVRKIGGVTAIALLFAWMLGVHRRWIF